MDFLAGKASPFHHPLGAFRSFSRARSESFDRPHATRTVAEAGDPAWLDYIIQSGSGPKGPFRVTAGPPGSGPAAPAQPALPECVTFSVTAGPGSSELDCRFITRDDTMSRDEWATGP